MDLINKVKGTFIVRMVDKFIHPHIFLDIIRRVAHIKIQFRAQITGYGLPYFKIIEKGFFY